MGQYRVILANSNRVMADYKSIGYKTYGEVCRFMEGLSFGAHCAGMTKAGTVLLDYGVQIHSCNITEKAQDVINRYLHKD